MGGVWGWSKGWSMMESIRSAYLFLEGDLREVVDGAIVSCVELTRKVAKIAPILEEMCVPMSQI